MCVLCKSAGYLVQKHNLWWKFRQYCLAARNQCTETFFSYRKQQTLTWLQHCCFLKTYKKEFLWLLVTEGQRHHFLHLKATTKIARCSHSHKVIGNTFSLWNWPFACKHLHTVTKCGPAVEETGRIKIATHFVKTMCDKLSRLHHVITLCPSNKRPMVTHNVTLSSTITGVKHSWIISTHKKWYKIFRRLSRGWARV